MGYSQQRRDGPPVLTIAGFIFVLFLFFGIGGSLDLDGRIYVSYLPDRFYGWDVKGLNWQYSDFSWERESTYDIMQNYGVNMIRRHFSGEPVYDNNSGYMARLERCADLAAERGMWVVFDLYSWGVGSDYDTVRFTAERQWDNTSPYWTDARWNQLWTNMGNRFKNHGNVILELMNEPDDYSGSLSGNAMYDATATRCASTITLLRNLGFTNYIGIPPLEFGATLTPWVTRYTTIDAADTLNKFFFFMHYYHYWHGGGTSQSQIRTYLASKDADTIQNLGYRVCIGEFGVHGYEAQQSSTERNWFQNFLFVQRDDGYDTCYQSFQPGSDFPGIQSEFTDSYWPTRERTSTCTWLIDGFILNNVVYQGVPSDLQYYTTLPYDDGTLTVTAKYQNGTSIGADGQVWSQGTGSTSYLGFSSYPRTASGNYSLPIIDNVIDAMDDANLSIYRMSVWYTLADSTRDWVIQHFLDSCNYDLIVCYHDYPSGAMRPNWATAQAWALDVAATFSAYPDRLWIEFANERTDAGLAAESQTIVTAIRNAGYTNKLVVNKWNQTWSDMAGISDPLDKFYTGYHYYFNTWSVSGATGQMEQAMSAGIPGHRLINTEIGADFNEETAFSESEVGEVNSFMAWCADHNISNTVWQRYGLQNYDTYQDMNLTFPIVSTRQLMHQGQTPFTVSLDAGVYDVAVRWQNATQTRVTSVFADAATVEAFLFPGPPPPPPDDQYQVRLLGATGGSTVPGAGIYQLLVSHMFSATAYAAADYVFTRWLKDGAEWGTTKTIAFNGIKGAVYMVQPDFTYSGGGEPAEPVPDWRRPNPYVPEQGEGAPDPVDGARIPYSLPDPALPVVDHGLFTLFLRQLTKTSPPDYAVTLRRLSRTQPPELTDILNLLTQAKVTT